MGHETIGFFRRWLVLAAVIVVASGMAEAHSMKQVRSEISAGKGSWEASVWLEAWALYPEDGPKVPPGTPGDPGTAGNDWAEKLDAADHAVMREVAASKMR